MRYRDQFGLAHNQVSCWHGRDLLDAARPKKRALEPVFEYRNQATAEIP